MNAPHTWPDVRPYPNKPLLSHQITLDNTPQELADKLELRLWDEPRDRSDEEHDERRDRDMMERLEFRACSYCVDKAECAERRACRCGVGQS
ncbi:MAG: hypothetical protein Q8N17_26290 [Burkholderiaceae bacterium]|nr:hypothetical protein [Burkholderiaceae bacterium]